MKVTCNNMVVSLTFHIMNLSWLIVDLIFLVIPDYKSIINTHLTLLYLLSVLVDIIGDAYIVNDLYSFRFSEVGSIWFKDIYVVIIIWKIINFDIIVPYLWDTNAWYMLNFSLYWFLNISYWLLYNFTEQAKV